MLQTIKERFLGFFLFCLIIGVLVTLFVVGNAYEKSDERMDHLYGVWFEGEDAQNLAANSERLAEVPEEFVYLVKVGEKMEVQDVIQHRMYREGHESTVSYSIQYKNGRNELVDYEFSYVEQIKIVYQDNITKPILKRIENDVYQNNNRTTVKIPKFMNYIIYMPENTSAMKSENHYETCTGNRGNNNYRCETKTVESQSLVNK